MVEREAERVELRPVPPRTERQHQPPATDLVDGVGHLGRQGRVSERPAAHERPQRDPRRDRGKRRHQRPPLPHPDRLVLPPRQPEQQVIRHPQRVEPQLLRSPRDREQVRPPGCLPCHRPLDRRQQQPDLQRPPPCRDVCLVPLSIAHRFPLAPSTGRQPTADRATSPAGSGGLPSGHTSCVRNQTSVSADGASFRAGRRSRPRRLPASPRRRRRRAAIGTERRSFEHAPRGHRHEQSLLVSPDAPSPTPLELRRSPGTAPRRGCRPERGQLPRDRSAAARSAGVRRSGLWFHVPRPSPYPHRRRRRHPARAHAEEPPGRAPSGQAPPLPPPS
jgi:hypothetical protein